MIKIREMIFWKILETNYLNLKLNSMKRVTVVHEIQAYIFMLEESKKDIYTSHAEIRADLFKEFGLDVSVEDIAKVYEPMQEEDSLDLKIMMRNMYSW